LQTLKSCLATWKLAIKPFLCQWTNCPDESGSSVSVLIWFEVQAKTVHLAFEIFTKFHQLEVFCCMHETKIYTQSVQIQVSVCM
jgi:hypothetical protein